MSEQKHTRIHLVTVGDTKRLVKAVSKNAAIRHVAQGLMTVRVASQDDIVEALSKGVPVETAGDDPEVQHHSV